jgi:RNA polymerase sigma-70 factor (ECF subfamily)
MLNQSELIVQLKQGDAAAFTKLVNDCEDMVYNTVLGIVQHPQDADDITQEVFIQVYRSISSFKAESKLSTWLYRIAVTKALDFEKQQKEKSVLLFCSPSLEGTMLPSSVYPILIIRVSCLRKNNHR